MKKIVIPLVGVALLFTLAMGGQVFDQYDLTENFTWDDSSETQTVTLDIKGAYHGQDGYQLYNKMIATARCDSVSATFSEMDGTIDSVLFKWTGLFHDFEYVLDSGTTAIPGSLLTILPIDTITTRIVTDTGVESTAVAIYQREGDEWKLFDQIKLSVTVWDTTPDMDTSSTYSWEYHIKLFKEE